jgi:hypothetical protein
MTRFFITRWLTVTPIILVLVAVLMPTGKANAGCGDYVLVGDHEKVKQTESAPQRHVPRSPCNGPGCSRQNVPLLPIPAPASSHHASDDCLSLSQTVNTPDETRHEFTSFVAGSLRRTTIDIFHPPR